MTAAVLVTGGAGYIGSHTVARLVELGHRVVVLDTLEYGSRQALGDVPLVVGDVADRAAVTALCRQHEVGSVIHFAAYKFVGESMEQPGKYWRNNVSGTIELLAALQEAGVRDVVFSSSCSVYGTASEMPVNESTPFEPQSVYAATKAMVEQILTWSSRTEGMRTVSLRYFNASGAHPSGDIGEVWDRAQNLIPLVMRSALGAGSPVQVRGTDYPTPDGTGVRDYVHVCDLADAHVAALQYLAAGKPSTAFNVGTGRGFSVMEVIRAAERAAGRPIPFELADRRPGDVAAVWGDTTRAREELGWEATRSLDDIVADAWRWHSTHPNGYG
jgi:UDP-glucose-4-epimerase GalE